MATLFMLSTFKPLPEEHGAGKMRFLGVPLCHRCGTAGYRDEQFCPQCGEEFDRAQLQHRAEQRCPACNAAVRHPVAFFCTACGNELPPEASNQHPHAANGRR